MPSFDPNKLRPRFEHLHVGKALSLFNAALFLPDAAFTWAHRARPVVRQAIRDYHPVVIFSSALPASAHMLGQWTREATGLPWVTDFRDPWSENELQPYLPGYRALNRRLEARVLAATDRITTVSPPLAEMFARLSGDPARVRLIENGYDPEDVTLLPPPHTERFTVTYTGEFSRIRRPDAFVEAIDRLVAAGSIPLDELRVAFAGKDTAKFVPDRPPYEQLGYLSHDDLSALASRHRSAAADPRRVGPEPGQLQRQDLRIPGLQPPDAGDHRAGQRSRATDQPRAGRHSHRTQPGRDRSRRAELLPGLEVGRVRLRPRLGRHPALHPPQPDRAAGRTIGGSEQRVKVLLVMTARTVGGAEIYVERLTAALADACRFTVALSTTPSWPTWAGGWPVTPRC